MHYQLNIIANVTVIMITYMLNQEDKFNLKRYRFQWMFLKDAFTEVVLFVFHNHSSSVP